MKLHPDLPETPTGKLAMSAWQLPVPLDDIAAALSSHKVIGITELAEITDISISYHGVDWEPGDLGGTELSLVMIARLNDGWWIGVEAWNDYTGWGCRDGSDAYMGPSRDDVIANGITNDGRSALGLETL